MFIEKLKQPLKKLFAVHSAYKLARDFRTIPKAKMLDIETIRDITKVLPKTMLPMPRLFDLYDLVRRINGDGISGDLVECGVWNGGAVGLMGIANRRFPGPERRLHLFDSFEGLPPPTEQDADVYAGYAENAVAETNPEELTAIGSCKGDGQPIVERFLVDRIGLPRQQLVFHVGWFQDTVPAARKAIGNIALLRLDGDWYESTKVCIENLYDKLVPGGFLVIDDYGCFDGCRHAIDEFFASRARPEWAASDKHCVYFRKT